MKDPPYESFLDPVPVLSPIPPVSLGPPHAIRREALLANQSNRNWTGLKSYVPKTHVRNLGTILGICCSKPHAFTVHFYCSSFSLSSSTQYHTVIPTPESLIYTHSARLSTPSHLTSTLNPETPPPSIQQAQQPPQSPKPKTNAQRKTDTPHQRPIKSYKEHFAQQNRTERQRNRIGRKGREGKDVRHLNRRHNNLLPD